MGCRLGTTRSMTRQNRTNRSEAAKGNGHIYLSAFAKMCLSPCVSFATGFPKVEDCSTVGSATILLCSKRALHDPDRRSHLRKRRAQAGSAVAVKRTRESPSNHPDSG